MNLTPPERELFRSRFAMALANLHCIEVYFSPGIRKIFARSHPAQEESLFITTHGRRAMPIDVVRVGVYVAPFCSGDFLGDLDDTIARTKTILAQA